MVFSPLSIAGLVGWYDFSDAGTLFTDAGTTPVLNDGDLIYQANDKSGGGRHVVQATSGARPTYKKNILNGRSVSRYDGADHLLYNTVTSTDNTQTLFAVITNASPTTGITAVSNGGVSMMVGTGINAVGVDFIQLADGVGSIDTTLDVNAASHILVMQMNEPSSGLAVISGVGQASFDGVAGALPSGIAIGGEAGEGPGGRAWTDDICEAAVYNTVLSVSDINKIGRYFATKWNLTWTTVT